MTSKVEVQQLKQVKTILVSQPLPKRSPYSGIESKYGVKVDFRSFIHVEGISSKEFRKQKMNPEDYTAIIFTSKNSVIHFFRICEEMRIKMSQDTKYFCTSEAIALYLQKFVVYRKRKVFFGNRTLDDLKPSLNKYKKKEKFLLPSSDLGKPDFSSFLKEGEFDFDEAFLYQTVSSDLSDLSDIVYDMLIFFSPFSIQSLFENFPDFEQNDTRIAAYGNSTRQAVLDKGLKLNIQAPTKESYSMTAAIESYLKLSNLDE
jgi:uroporphyrinogen-III synthase